MLSLLFLFLATALSVNLMWFQYHNNHNSNWRYRMKHMERHIKLTEKPLKHIDYWITSQRRTTGLRINSMPLKTLTISLNWKFQNHSTACENAHNVLNMQRTQYICWTVVLSWCTSQTDYHWNCRRTFYVLCGI